MEHHGHTETDVEHRVVDPHRQEVVGTVSAGLNVRHGPVVCATRTIAGANGHGTSHDVNVWMSDAAALGYRVGLGENLDCRGRRETPSCECWRSLAKRSYSISTETL